MGFSIWTFGPQRTPPIVSLPHSDALSTRAAQPVADGVGQMMRYMWLALLFVTPVLLVLPVGEGGGGLALANWLGAYPAGLAERIYAMIKVAMLWLLPGMLLVLVSSRVSIQRTASALALSSLVVGWLALPSMGWDGIREVFYALFGLAAGVWVGERLGILDDNPAPIASTFSVAKPHAEEGGVPVRDDVVAFGQHTKKSANGRAAGRVAGMVVAAITLASLVDFPLWRVEIALGLVVYSVVLWFRPGFWMVVIPCALPLFDLAPWTGRFFWDEFDLLMLVTIALALWQGQFSLSVWRVPRLGILLATLMVAWLVSVFMGLLPLQPLDANAFSAYWSHYNSLRLAKGLLWGWVFYALYLSQTDARRAFTQVSSGMALGVLGVSLWMIWEQAVFAGAATTADYRVTAGFSSMHTGGGHIEAYLVIALPFVWAQLFRSHNVFIRAGLGAIFLLGAYELFSTVSRGGAIALGLMLITLVVGTWLALRKQSGRRTGTLVPWAMGGLTLVLMAVGISGVFWQQRLTQTTTDAGIRFHHWAEVLDMQDSGIAHTLFGQGVGSLPAANLVTQLPAHSGSYRYANEAGNTFLALNSAGTLYMAQRVDSRPDSPLTLEVSVRAPVNHTGLEASLCEKILFNSLRCRWIKVDFDPANLTWQHHNQTFNSGEIGAGNGLMRRPVQFSLYNTVPGTVIHIDNIRLLDERGRNLIHNGDFSKGGDFWFFKSGDHLFWHAKNLWVHLVFEQGWIGAILFTMILLLALIRLARSALGGQLEATAWLASIVAWIVVGGVDSLVDAPRISVLVYSTLLIGAAWGTPPRTGLKRKRRRRHKPESGNEVVSLAQPD